MWLGNYIQSTCHLLSKNDHLRMENELISEKKLFVAHYVPYYLKQHIGGWCRKYSCLLYTCMKPHGCIFIHPKYLLSKQSDLCLHHRWIYVQKCFPPPGAFYFAPVLKDPELTCFSRHKEQVGTLTGT